MDSAINYSVDSVSHWRSLSESIATENGSVGDPFFAVRDELWIGYNTMSTNWNVDFVDYKNVGFRWRWYKLINGSGGGGDGHQRPPNAVNGDGDDNGVWPQIYDLQSDPFEFVNRTDNASDLVTAMKERMFEFERTGVPQIDNDTTRFPIVTPNNSDVGLVWTPYCD